MIIEALILFLGFFVLSLVNYLMLHRVDSLSRNMQIRNDINKQILDITKLSKSEELTKEAVRSMAML